MSSDTPTNPLAQLPFMFDLNGDLPARLQATFNAIAHPVDIDCDTVLLREGENTTNEGYILINGAVRIEKAASPSTTAHAPALLGEMKQFHPEQRRGATVTALTPLKVLQFDWTRFDQSLAKSFTPEEQTTIREALRRYAWLHFFGEIL